MTRCRIDLAIFALTGVLLGAGCTSPVSRFYVLSTLPARAEALSGGRESVGIGVGPIEFPDYLDRPQIVTRTNQNELELAEFDRWGESLKDNAAQVLVENLSLLLRSPRVVAYPWRRATPIDYQITAQVLRFDYTHGGSSTLIVRWSILGGDGTSELLARRSRYLDRPANDSYGAIVASMNRNLAAFSRDAAQAVKAASAR